MTRAPIFKFCAAFRSSLPIHAMEIFRVFSARLDASKSWYIFNKASSSLRKYNDNSFFRLFPDEVKKNSFLRVRDASGSPLDPNVFRVKHLKCEILTASTLGLCGGLIRQRELNDQSYLASDSFKRIAQAININCSIAGLPRNGANSV